MLTRKLSPSRKDDWSTPDRLARANADAKRLMETSCRDCGIAVACGGAYWPHGGRNGDPLTCSNATLLMAWSACYFGMLTP
jgi:hypothetical protein